MSRAQDARKRTARSAHHSASLAPAKEFAMPFAVGEVVGAKYEIDSLLGVGSIGFVVSARRLDLGDQVALKFLRPESLANDELVARFAQEARVSANIKSDHVARVLDVATPQNGSPFIVMERLEGRDLGRILNEAGPLPVPVAIEYVLEVCEALAAAHAQGIVHRDIKPENLFLSELSNGEDIVKVLDFGISKAALAEVFDPERLVRTSLILGSPVYMSPEQIRESATVDERTDIWSIGCVLYELLSGSPAFDGNSLMQLCSIILEQWPSPLTAFNPHVTPELEAVVWRCLAKDPSERFQDVAELASALGACAPAGAQVWVERCKFLLTDRGPASVREPSVPPSSRGSFRGPISSRRTLPPVAVQVSVANVRSNRRWQVAAVALAASALAVVLALTQGNSIYRAHEATRPPNRDQPLAARLGVQPATRVEPAAARAVESAPLRVASLAVSASSASSRPAVVVPPATVQARIVRQSLSAVSAPRARPARAAIDDEPDVGY